MAHDEETISWLLDSDPAIAYQASRDLLGKPAAELEKLRLAIGKRGWGRELLGHRKADGNWGNGFYNPKWTCTNYALSELMQLGFPPGDGKCGESCSLVYDLPRGKDGGINFAKTVERSDVCVNGMILAYESYFLPGDARARELVDYLLKVRMSDGGWNCEYIHQARKSSLHTTISVLEGLGRFRRSGDGYRKREILTAMEEAIEFILAHRLYKTKTTGETIRDDFLAFCYPVRWKYDILRCLDFFREFSVPRDPRMDEALDIVAKAGGKKGRWKARSQPGKTFFLMEKNGSESRWNTLRALRVLSYFGARA